MIKDINYFLALNYKIELTKSSKEEGGEYCAEIPLLPTAMGFGNTPEEALAELETAKELWLEATLEGGGVVPEPEDENYKGSFQVRTSKTNHRALAKAAENQGVSLNAYINQVFNQTLQSS